MGLRPVQYGSVFLYKNGFRINPFGNVGDDSLGIDRRKQQGQSRFLGTRDLSGRIEINGKNPDFQETSSRDGGLIKNKAFEALRELFFTYALRRLENFVINLLKLGKEGEFPELLGANTSELRQRAFDVVSKLAQSRDVVFINFDPKVLNVLESRSAESVSAWLGSLKRISAEQNDQRLTKEINRAERHVKLLTKAREEAEAEAEQERSRAEAAESRAEEAEQTAAQATQEAEEARQREKALDTQNIFLKGVLSRDLERVLTLHHSIGQHAQTIENNIANIVRMIKDDQVSDYTKLRKWLTGMSLSAKKIDSISRFATRANFRAEQESVTSDLVEYIREYFQNVYGGAIEDSDGNSIPISFKQPPSAKFITSFAPLNVSIVFDNLLSNAMKHNVEQVVITVIEANDDFLKISFADDGKGISSQNLPHLFKMGFSTTRGSGLGLYHVRELMTRLKGSIEVNPDAKQGAEFVLIFTKRS